MAGKGTGSGPGGAPVYGVDYHSRAEGGILGAMARARARKRAKMGIAQPEQVQGQQDAEAEAAAAAAPPAMLSMDEICGMLKKLNGGGVWGFRVGCDGWGGGHLGGGGRARCRPM